MPTVTFLKRMFQTQIAPGDDSEFLRILTEADMRLLLYGRHRWTHREDTLTPVNGIITLPATYASILGARVGKDAVDIRDFDYEFVPGGRGEVQIGNGSSRLIDQGMNEEGLREYKVTGYLGEDEVITALMHLSPVTLMDPDIADSMVPEDATINTRCPDATALKLTMLGIVTEEAQNLNDARQFFADAIRSLDAKEQSQRGNATRTINSRPMGMGIRKVRSWR